MAAQGQPMHASSDQHAAPASLIHASESSAEHAHHDQELGSASPAVPQRTRDASRAAQPSAVQHSQAQAAAAGVLGVHASATGAPSDEDDDAEKSQVRSMLCHHT